MSSHRRIETYEDFVKVHGLLLAASGLPHSLHRQLFEKLSAETFDGGVCFQIEPCEGDRQRRLVLTSESMEKDSHCFLVDHAWTFRLSDAYKQLREIPGLAQRMASLMCVDIDLDSDAEETDLANGDSCNDAKLDVAEILECEIRKAREDGDGIVRWLELDELDIDDDMLLSLDLSSKFPDLRALSLCDNKLHKVEVILREVTKFKHLRALWLNNNPLLQKSDACLSDAILQGSPRLEIYNSHFTHNYGDWALGFCGGIYGKDNPGCNSDGDHPLEGVTSLDLSDRCIHILINKVTVLSVLHV